MQVALMWLGAVLLPSCINCSRIISVVVLLFDGNSTITPPSIALTTKIDVCMLLWVRKRRLAHLLTCVAAFWRGGLCFQAPVEIVVIVFVLFFITVLIGVIIPHLLGPLTCRFQ